MYDTTLVNPNFMAAGFNKLTKLQLGNSSISSPQMLEFFERMAKFTKLQYLDLSFLDLCGISPPTFSEALINIPKVILLDCHVIMDQLVTLFRATSLSTNLQHLDLSLIPLTFFSIYMEDFIEGALKLKILRLVDTCIPKDFVEEILRRATQETKLEMLEIILEDSCDVSDLVLAENHHIELRISEEYGYDEGFNTIF